MKILHIHATGRINIKDILKNLKFKGKLGLVSTVQFVHNLKELSEQIPGSKVCGQVLGCNALKAKRCEDEVDAYLFVGTGLFHPIEIAKKTNKDVYMANPEIGTIKKLDRKIIDKLNRRIKAAYLHYLRASKIGILVSTKPGQNRLKEALKFKKSLKDKRSYIFMFDTLNYMELDNFPDIECWINTACPRIVEDEHFTKPIINIDDIKNFEK